MDGHQRKITSYFSLPPVDQSAVNKSQLNKDQSGDSDESMNSDVEMNEDSSDLEDNEVYWKDDDAKMDNQKKTDDDEVVSWLQLRNDKKSQKLLALFRSWQDMTKCKTIDAMIHAGTNEMVNWIIHSTERSKVGAVYTMFRTEKQQALFDVSIPLGVRMLKLMDEAIYHGSESKAGARFPCHENPPKGQKLQSIDRYIRRRKKKGKQISAVSLIPTDEMRYRPIYPVFESILISNQRKIRILRSTKNNYQGKSVSSYIRNYSTNNFPAVAIKLCQVALSQPLVIKTTKKAKKH